MLEGRDLLFFGGDWDRFPNGFQQIAEVLARFNRILWVGSLSIRRPRLHLYDLRRITGRVTHLLSTQSRHPSESALAGNVYPFVIPYYDFPGIRVVNDVLLRTALRTKMKALDFRTVIAFPSTPLVAGLIGTLGESSSHYFCMDDYTQYDGAYRCIGKLEQETLQKVDSCFALSEPLMQTRKAKSGENHYLPMGVDIEHFNQPPGPLPAELSSVRKPIAGFFGQIGTYVDIELILECAKAYPHVSFVVIGRPLVHVDMSVLDRASNIFFLGEVPYQRIPQYARAFDIGLNPRTINKLSVTMNPVKLLEYLSVGMPVVSTDLPAVRTFKDFVYVAETRETFVKLVGTALQDTSKEKREARRSLARQYSWTSIAERISETIGRIDEEKRKGRR